MPAEQANLPTPKKAIRAEFKLRYRGKPICQANWKSLVTNTHQHWYRHRRIILLTLAATTAWANWIGICINLFTSGNCRGFRISFTVWVFGFSFRLEVELIGVVSKRLALKALDRDPEVWKTLCNLLISLHGTHSEFLPVLYAALDPAKIPTSDEMEANPHSPITTQSLDITRWTMIILRKIPIPMPVCPDFWPRFWQWANFSQAYVADTDEEERNCEDFLIIMGKLFESSDTVRLIYRTPTVRRLAARAWRVSLELDPSGEHLHYHPALTGLSLFISGGKLGSKQVIKDPEHFEELVDGAGGTISDLAYLVVAHLTHFLPSPSTPRPRLADAVVFYLSTALIFIDNSEGDNQHFHAALLEHRFIPLLINLLGFALHHPDFVPCLSTLVKIITTADHHRMRQALESGMIGVALLCSIHPSKFEPACVNDFLTVLAQSLVYYPVVVQMADCISDIEDRLQDSDFRTSQVFEKWEVLLGLAKTRIEIQQHFDSDVYQSLRNCDNLECGDRFLKAQLRRCSKCLTSYYCSRDCQALDWRAGHRLVCQAIQMSHHAYPETLTTREISFLRLLVLHCYEATVYHRSKCYVVHLARNPEATVYSMFDYTQERSPEVIWLDLVDLHPPKRCLISEWAYTIERMARSAGPMEMLLMSVREGGEARYRLFPLRLDSSTKLEAFRRISNLVASHLISTELELEDEVRAALANTHGTQGGGLDVADHYIFQRSA
ncbi:hypothetical protein C8J57DRAFT_1732434 [Mycena rebaudengoi]|nr:hypothetical protein C8J57DRAFT_1732434 [Mycena rebaudengoi]